MAKTKTNAPGIKRREAMIEAAWTLFMQKGYTAVSVDEIIRMSGGSKSSFYVFFGSKEGLFMEIVTSVTNQLLEEFMVPVTSGLSARESLTRIGRTIGNKILTEKGTGLYRLSASISWQFPEISRMFYESGPKRGWKGLAEYLRKEVSAGRLRIKDPLMAAEFFFGMIISKDHISMPLGCSGPPPKQRVERLVAEAVDVFMAAYGNVDSIG
ncbi:MAG: TetR/AcrR family transcriptional regulator [Thermodesulfobacteriota bacterium]|nr:MAG: TetR/AcrR family transcriptional regulator [Thermodesulfobacteriota bacterium]